MLNAPPASLLHRLGVVTRRTQQLALGQLIEQTLARPASEGHADIQSLAEGIDVIKLQIAGGPALSAATAQMLHCPSLDSAVPFTTVGVHVLVVVLSALSRVDRWLAAHRT